VQAIPGRRDGRTHICRISRTHALRSIPALRLPAFVRCRRGRNGPARNLFPLHVFIRRGGPRYLADIATEGTASRRLNASSVRRARDR
jgi:hypothetical protein